MVCDKQSFVQQSINEYNKNLGYYAQALSKKSLKTRRNVSLKVYFLEIYRTKAGNFLIYDPKMLKTEEYYDINIS